MKNLLLLLIFPLLSFAFTSCDDEGDTTPMDLELLAGTWEVVESDIDNRNCIYEIKSASDKTHGSYSGYYGTITTYYLTSTGTPLFDKEYTWTIRYAESHQPLLDLILVGELDSDDPWAGNYYYKIIKLTDSNMWWRGNSNGDNSIIKFRRRTDIENQGPIS